MKTMKKLLSIVMVLTLVLSLGVSALAVDITIGGNGKDTGNKGLDPNSTYTAYKLFDATFERNDGTKEAPKDVYVYHINPKFSAAILAGLTAPGMPTEVTSRNTGHSKQVAQPKDLTDEQAVLEYISGLGADDVRTFADAVFANINKDSLTKDTDYYETKADGDGNAKFSNVAGGYYLIAETVADGTQNAVTSLVMLDTAGKDTVTVNTKENVPSSEKKVLDNNDSEKVQPVPGVVNDEWQDSADHDVGDTIYFKLTGTLPADFANYETYKLIFHDHEQQGLNFQGITAVYYVDTDGNATEITNGYTSVPDPSHENCTFEVSFADVNAIEGATGKLNPTAGGQIVVVYSSKLEGKNVVYGSGGNWNTMYMEYSNNSYDNGEGTSRTPDDQVVVFTYKMHTNKVDGLGQPLTGAQFTLYKQVKELPAGAGDDEYITVGEGAEATYWKVMAMVATTEGTEFGFDGLDDGFYRLEETKVPEGYNKADDVYFKVEAAHEADAAHPELKSLTVTVTDSTGKALDTDKQEGVFTIEMTSGTISNTVVNNTGLELPSTGGIGTTIFYVVGAILVAGAVILLVTKKRVNGASK